VEVATSWGLAEVSVHGSAGAPFLVVLTHGAGGLPGTLDLLAARDAALAAGGAVALVTQPYRVSGARAPGSAVRQDEAWTEIVAALRAEIPGATSVIVGGRSNGARVACRTAQAVGARAVIALAFPLCPPGKPNNSRVGELREPQTAGIPVLVVNGERDPFGIPDATDADRVVVVPGETHAMKGHTTVVRTAVAEWLTEVLA
jgi:predicted alpha/beta-hydrolase family hydrolase